MSRKARKALAASRRSKPVTPQDTAPGDLPLEHLPDDQVEIRVWVRTPNGQQHTVSGDAEIIEVNGRRHALQLLVQVAARLAAQAVGLAEQRGNVPAGRRILRPQGGAAVVRDAKGAK